MKILVINGDCIQTNTSANLCHVAYIKGLIDSGHDVTLLSADGRDYKLDPSIIIPTNVHQYTYYGVTFYEKLSLKKKKQISLVGSDITKVQIKAKISLKRKIINGLKSFALSFYGVHGIYSKFVRVAQIFKSDIHFDYVISLSTPVTSHVLAYNLLKAGHIHADHWIQIWEDPWYSDAYGFNGSKKIFEEEKRILSLAERICYVSPLTLKNQQKLYPESASKMYWQPLPYYYKNDTDANLSHKYNTYGYFGNYYSAARNLEPFYKAAINTGISANICGDPSNLFQSTEKVIIYPRLTLDKLKPIEDSTNVLIFLCNRIGGQIPGKIYQYSATNKIILFILDGTDGEKAVLKNYFEPFHRYIFCENTVEDITRAIKLIEAGNFGTIENKPVEAFNPKETIRKILEEGK